MSEAMRHPETERLQELATGRLDPADAAVVESHLASCGHCRGEVEEWRALFGALGGLDLFAPATGFSDRVMARVDMRAPWTVRLLAVLDRLVPRTTRGWALVGAMMAVPALVYGGAVAWLASRPWFSTGWLLDIAREGLVGTLTSTAIGAWQWVMGLPAVQWLAATLTTTGTETLGLGAAAFGTATVVSAWVLYRNLFRTPSRESGYATFAF